MAHFREQVSSLVGKNIRLGRGGPDERQGTLVAIKSDYLTLFSEDGSLVHYPLHHLKSITEIVNAEKEPDIANSPVETLAGLPDTLTELMTSFIGAKVQVYDHGPETAIGLVFGVGDDFVKLVSSPDEMIHYPFFHIRSVRLTKAKVKENNQKEQEGKEQEGKEQGGKEKSRGRGERERSRKRT